ncbi:hypothetical protein D3C79_762090 [compost metagenome]
MLSQCGRVGAAVGFELPDDAVGDTAEGSALLQLSDPLRQRVRIGLRAGNIIIDIINLLIIAQVLITVLPIRRGDQVIGHGVCF